MTERHVFPELRRVFSGYLHEDFVMEYGTPEQALAEFLADASDDERRRFTREADRFLRETESLHFDDVKRLLERLGSRWVPKTREELVKWLNTGHSRSGAP